jgi:anti-anti-sigma regulatory factor
MFRITVDEHPAGATMRVEGRFARDAAEEAKHAMMCRNTPAGLVVDLSEVTFADAAGEKALGWLRSIGAKFVAETSYSLHLCECLHLPRLSVLIP